jgi:NAD-dependent deacetylase
MNVPHDTDPIAEVRRLLENARRVCAFTGAGISAESGIPTYRGTGGLWSGFSAEDLASPQGFARDPKRVWQWHNERRMALAAVKPNAGHTALAKLEEIVTSRGHAFTLATQNIDGLHQAAGSRSVLELHGTILTIRCDTCWYRRAIGFEPIEGIPFCPKCRTFMRPDIVWFGEMLPQDVWQRAAEAAAGADVLLAVGTSAVVYPAVGLIDLAARNGARTVEINLEPTAATGAMDIALHGKAGEILPAILPL